MNDNQKDFLKPSTMSESERRRIHGKIVSSNDNNRSVVVDIVLVGVLLTIIGGAVWILARSF